MAAAPGDGHPPRTWTAWVRSYICRVLATGGVPDHLAIIMDGNRRFAQARQLQPQAGHERGYDRLLDALDWCLELGVKVVSVYAFSLDNFKRPPAEVDALMALAESKLIELQRRGGGLMSQRGVRVIVAGDLSRLPPGVQRAAARVMRDTARHDAATLIVCLGYTSRDDVASAVGDARRAVRSGALSPGDVTPTLLESCLLTAPAPPVGLLLRTSGERRLSDFMAWQSGTACLAFLPVLWPQFSVWDLATAVRMYQHHVRCRAVGGGGHACVGRAGDNGGGEGEGDAGGGTVPEGATRVPTDRCRCGHTATRAGVAHGHTGDDNGPGPPTWRRWLRAGGGGEDRSFFARGLKRETAADAAGDAAAARVAAFLAARAAARALEIDAVAAGERLFAPHVFEPCA